MGVSDASTQRRNDEQTIRTGRGTSGQKEPKRTGTVVETMQIRTELLYWNEWLECLTVSGQNGLLTAKLAPFLVWDRGSVLLIPPGVEFVTLITVAFISQSLCINMAVFAAPVFSQRGRNHKCTGLSVFVRIGHMHADR